jgi:hypothetical protein
VSLNAIKAACNKPELRRSSMHLPINYCTYKPQPTQAPRYSENGCF